MKERKQILNSLGAFLHSHPLQTGILAVFGILLIAIATFASLLEVYPTNVVTENPIGKTPQNNPFENLVLEARAAYVLDINQGEALYALNEEAQLPLASITKLMTALIILETLENEDIVVIESTAVAQNGDDGFVTNERFRVKDLLDFTLLESSNDGAYALAVAAGSKMRSSIDTGKTNSYSTFVSRMNVKAHELGLAQTYYTNATGLDSGEHVSGGYGSARDVAFLFRYLIANTPSAVAATRYLTLELQSSEAIYTANNTNEAIHSIPGLIASKTGYTDLAGGNLAVVFDVGINRPLVAVVLGSTQEGRFRDIQKLVWIALDAIQN